MEWKSCGMCPVCNKSHEKGNNRLRVTFIVSSFDVKLEILLGCWKSSVGKPLRLLQNSATGTVLFGKKTGEKIDKLAEDLLVELGVLASGKKTLGLSDSTIEFQQIQQITTGDFVSDDGEQREVMRELDVKEHDNTIINLSRKDYMPPTSKSTLLEPFNQNSQTKRLVIIRRSDCGTGKTDAIIRDITEVYHHRKNQLTEDTSFLISTGERETTTRAIHNRFEKGFHGMDVNLSSRDIQVTFYKQNNKSKRWTSPTR